MQTNIFYPKSGKIDSIEKAFVEVILGRPSAKCKHLGICKIERVYSNSLDNLKSKFCNSSDSLYALAGFKKEDYFELTFERDSIPKSVYDYHFKNGFFTIEEEYIADIKLDKSPIVIPVGKYNIRLSNTLLTVRFEIN